VPSAQPGRHSLDGTDWTAQTGRHSLDGTVWTAQTGLASAVTDITAFARPGHPKQALEGTHPPPARRVRQPQPLRHGAKEAILT